MLRPKKVRKEGSAVSELQLSKAGRKLLEMGQCGVLSPGGQDVCIKSIKMEMDKHPDWCFAELDGANAFNSQDRNAMFKGAQELMPFMLPP